MSKQDRSAIIRWLMAGVCQHQVCQAEPCIGMAEGEGRGALSRQHALDCTDSTGWLMEKYPGPPVAPGATVLDNLLARIQLATVPDKKEAIRDASEVIRNILFKCRGITVKENGGWQSVNQVQAQEELEETGALVREITAPIRDPRRSIRQRAHRQTHNRRPGRPSGPRISKRGVG